MLTVAFRHVYGSGNQENGMGLGCCQYESELGTNKQTNKTTTTKNHNEYTPNKQNTNPSNLLGASSLSEFDNSFQLFGDNSV